jgi:hypothetical protein
MRVSVPRPKRWALVCPAVLALATAPAVAYGQAAPFTPLAPAQGETQPTVVATQPTTDSGGGLQTWQQVLIFAAGVILLAGIGWAIVSDARSRAPVREGDTHRPGGTTKPRRSEREKQRARARAKAARAQRKRSR